MKNKHLYITIICAVSFIGCDPEFNQPLEDTPIAVQENGTADFSNYVAVGASITAGLSDGALYIEGQEVSFPKLLANQMEAAGGGPFTLPLMADNIGGFAGFEDQNFGTRLVLSGNPLGDDSFPVRANNNVSQNNITDLISGLYNNIGIPSLKSFHTITPGYGLLNPYFGRMATSENGTVLEDAIAQNPTFFSLWLGGNDVLSYATNGGTGVNQTGNIDITTYGNNDITDPNVFANSLNTSIDGLKGNNASGIIFNVPAVIDLPFFTTIENNLLVLSAEQAASLTGFFQAYSAIFEGGATLNLIGLGLDPATASATANALAAQYAITFTEGANRFLIATEITNENPQGFRQMTEEELLLLTIDANALSNEGYGSVAITNDVLAVLGKLQLGETPTVEESTLVLTAVNPILDKDALDMDEISAITNATEAYNTIIDTIVDADPDLMLFDANALVNELRTAGLNFNGGTVFSALGSAFSLDGVHLSPRGNAVFANAVIEDMNAHFGSTLKLVEPILFKTVTLE